MVFAFAFTNIITYEHCYLRGVPLVITPDVSLSPKVVTPEELEFVVDFEVDFSEHR
jgi:hypothetical protein